MSPKTKKSKLSTQISGVHAHNNTPKPQWPLLKPLIPTCDLSLECLLDGQLIVVRKLLTTNLCQRYVNFLSTLPLTTTPSYPKKGEALRVNDRFQIDDSDFAEQLWSSTSLKELMSNGSCDWGGMPIGLNPNIRIYRYRPGQFFDKHYDESNTLYFPTSPPTLARTTWTLLIYLTACSGGETAFYPEHGQLKNFDKQSNSGCEPILISPDVGLALLHKHGDDCLLHESREIKDGEKWVIRSDLCVPT